jgi:hypothetical protein
LCHCEWNLCFRQNHFRLVFLGAGQHFLFRSNRFCSAFFCSRLSNTNVGVCLIGSQTCSDIIADINIGDVDGDNGKRRL